MPSAQAFQVNIDSTRLRPFFSSDSRSFLSSSTRMIAAANAPGSFGETRMPVVPSVPTTSGSAPPVVATRAVEHDIASTAGKGGFPGGGSFPGGGGGGGFSTAAPNAGGGARAAGANRGTGDILVHLTAPVHLNILVIAVALALLGGLIAGAAGGWRASSLRPADALSKVA